MTETSGDGSHMIHGKDATLWAGLQVSNFGHYQLWYVSTGMFLKADQFIIAVLIYQLLSTLNVVCFYSVANDFLRTLAQENRGRYHSVVQRSFDAHLFAHQLIEGRFKDPEVHCQTHIELSLFHSAALTSTDNYCDRRLMLWRFLQ